MRYFLSIVVLFVLAFPGVADAGDGAITYYVQLIRGTDSDQPPQAESGKVGSKLSQKLCCPFKWKHYWEICQRQVKVLPGQTVKVDLSNNRAAEIGLTKQGQRTVAAFLNAKLLARTSVPASDGMTVIGGDRDERSAWFIVVRRDKPGS
jgi:hypothetical protein